MYRKFKIKDRATNDELIDVKLIELNEKNIDEFMEFQNEILDSLDNKELYSPTTKEEYEYYMTKTHYILGIKTISENKLIAVSVYINKELDKENYGYDLGYSKNDLPFISQIESTLVSPRYRGNKLQQFMCAMLLQRAIENGNKYLTATVSPLNLHSLKTFEDMKFTNEKEGLKYGNLRRCIFSKKLF